VTTGTARGAWAPVQRALERLARPSHGILMATIAVALLAAAAWAILNIASPKYLGAIIAASLAGAVLLALPNWFDFLLYAAGFTMPYFVEFIFLTRDRGTLVITGTTLVAAVLAIVGMATGRMGRSRATLVPGVTLAMLAFLCANLLSLVNTSDTTLTLMSVLQEAEMLFVFLVLVNAMDDEAHLVLFLRGLYLGFAIQCVIYVIQNALGFSFDVLGNTNFTGATDLEAGRIGSQRGTFANAPATAALYFSLMTLTLMGLHLSRRKLPVRLMPVAGMMMGLGCLVLSAKRAPMLGFALAVVTMGVLLARHAPAALRRLLPVFISLGLAFLVCLPVFILRAEANHEAALRERSNLTRVAWNMYDAHPVLGVGAGTYDSIKKEYLTSDWSGWLYTVHTRYLLVLAESGLVGLVTMLVLYAIILKAAHAGVRRVAPDLRPLQVSLVAGLVAIYWEQIWDIFNSRQQGYLFWFMAALAVALPRAMPAAPIGDRT